MAKDLNAYSSDYFYKEALSYAKDQQTKNTVKYYINSAKKQRTRYNRQHKSMGHKSWWKDRFKVGWNVAHFDIYSETMTIGTGLKFRLGRWSDVFNFLFGAEYSYIMWMPDGSYGYDDSVYTIGHQVEIPVTLRFNLFKISEGSKFYIGCTGAFGFKIASGDYCKLNSTSIAIQPEIGIASNHFDVGIYFKKYLDDYNIVESWRYDMEDKRFGLFFTWFF